MSTMYLLQGATSLDMPLPMIHVKVIPQYSIAHPDPLLDINSHVISVNIFKMAPFSLQLDLARDVNRHFLVNEYGDLSFFSVVLN